MAPSAGETILRLSVSISRTPSFKERVKNSLNDLNFKALLCSAMDISMPYWVLKALITTFLTNGFSLAATLPITRDNLCCGTRRCV